MSCASAEPSATIFEYGMYIGINLQDILYGIELLLYFRTMQIFVARRRHPHKSDVFYAIFSTVMLVLITIWVAALSSFGQRMWLAHRNYPGGPVAYRKAYSSGPSMDLGRFSLAVLQQMADGLMIYRCRIVWTSRRVVILPSILWVINLGLGLGLDTSASMPGTTFFSGTTMKLGLAYFSSSTFLNVILSSMICYRLLSHARAVKKYLGDKHASPYITIVALIVESVLPFTLSSIAFLVSYGTESQSTVVFSFVHPLVMGISPQILILRAAKGDAWQKDESVPMPPESIIRTLPGHVDMSNLGRFDESGEDREVMRLEMLPNSFEQSGHRADQV